jgi:protein ImuB
VRALRLRSAALLEARELPAELFAQHHRGAGTVVPQLVERLRARLGVEAVHGLCLVSEHRPEAAWRIAEPRAGASAAPRRSTSVTAAAKGAARPLWLLPGPQALAGTAQAPCFDGALAIETGPERIETGWWDGGDIARDYYVARTTAGVRVWIFRERRAGGWFLHGLFG